MPNYTHICARSMLIFFGIFFPHTSVVCITILKTILGMTERYHHAVKMGPFLFVREANSMSKG